MRKQKVEKSVSPGGKRCAEQWEVKPGKGEKSKRQTHGKLLVTSGNQRTFSSLFFLKPGSRTQLSNPAQGLVSVAPGIHRHLSLQ